MSEELRLLYLYATVSVKLVESQNLITQLQQRIIDLESENKALKLIANSHSMSELRRNRIMAGDKLIKCPPAPESEEKRADYSIKPEFLGDADMDDFAMSRGGTDGE